jgi:prolyl-tRNA editing enzyme YbaK/EbsC (Cys-tRNA(Pro) deacylase)
VAPSGVERFRAATEHLSLDIRRMPDSTHTAADAAAALGVEVGAIVKSLVFVAVRDTSAGPEQREPVLVLVPGDRRADLDLLAAVVDARIEKADARTVKQATGFSIGGVPPIGHPQLVPTVIDASFTRFDVLWAAAGSAYDNFPLTLDNLVSWSGGRVAAVTS